MGFVLRNWKMRDMVIKLILLGDIHVGKTSIIQRILYNKYSEDLSLTIICGPP